MFVQHYFQVFPICILSGFPDIRYKLTQMRFKLRTDAIQTLNTDAIQSQNTDAVHTLNTDTIQTPNRLLTVPKTTGIMGGLVPVAAGQEEWAGEAGLLKT